MTDLRFVYFAEPIDQDTVREATSRHLRQDAADLLNRMGVGVYRPASAFQVNRVSVGPEITQINTHALGVCDAVLAFLPGGVASVGVPIEIEQAVVAGKPVAVVTGHVGWALDRPETNLMVFEHATDAITWLATCPVEVASAVIPFVVIQPNGPEHAVALPRRGYSDDAGLDLTCSETVTIKPGEFADVPTGVACGFPPGVWGMIIGRSSTLRKRSLMVNQAVIDPGYRGELFAGVFNLSSDPVTVMAGERVAQMVLLPSLSHLQPVWTDKLPASHDGRDTNGFGSTG